MFLNAIQQLYDYQREVTNHLLSMISWLTHGEYFFDSGRTAAVGKKHTVVPPGAQCRRAAPAAIYRS